MEKLIKGIHHIALECDTWDNYEETVNFYSKILGMDIVRTWGEGDSSGTMIDTGNGIVEIFAKGERLEQGAIKHFAFETDDVAGCLEVVRKAGYKIITETKDQVLPSKPKLPITFGFCIGPVGEEIEFLTSR